MIVFRRTFVSAALTVGLFGLSSRLSLAQDDGLFAIKGDDGQAIANFRLPAELAGDDVPGTVWAGSSAPEAILTEYFDYNCPYCRAAAPHFSALLKSDPVLKLGLVNNPVFGRASVQVASVQQAVLKTHGPDKTHAFHERMLGTPGPATAASALRAAADLGLDTAAISAAAAEPVIADVVEAQAQRARDLGFAVTPAFAIDAYGVLGYPGPRTMAAIVEAVQRCDKLRCPPAATSRSKP